jgi:hypothetical protein
MAGLAVVIAFLYLLVGAGGIAAGVGVVNRRPWGRILTLVLAGLCIVLAILALLGVFAGQTINLVAVAIFAGYAIVCFVILLNPQNAREFR